MIAMNVIPRPELINTILKKVLLWISFLFRLCTKDCHFGKIRGGKHIINPTMTKIHKTWYVPSKKNNISFSPFYFFNPFYLLSKFSERNVQFWMRYLVISAIFLNVNSASHPNIFLYIDKWGMVLCYPFQIDH